jgi:hypothetical protein
MTIHNDLAVNAQRLHLRRGQAAELLAMELKTWNDAAVLRVEGQPEMGLAGDLSLQMAVWHWLNLPKAAQNAATITVGGTAFPEFIEWRAPGIEWLAERLPG